MSYSKRVHSIPLQIYVLFLFLQSIWPVFFHYFRVKGANRLREIDFQISSFTCLQNGSFLYFIFYNFIFLFSKSINRIKYSVGRESIFAVVAHTLSSVRVFHPIVSGTLSAVRVFHPVASHTLSAVTIFAQIAEVLCRLSEYFRTS